MMPVQQLLVGNGKMIRTETPLCALIALHIMQTHKELHSARKSNDQLLGYSVKYVEHKQLVEGLRFKMHFSVQSFSFFLV